MGATVNLVSKSWRVLALQIAFVALAVVAGSMALTHSRTGQWSFSLGADAAPDRVHFHGRDYDRGSKMTTLPPDTVKQDVSTAGGGAIYVDNANVGTPTGIYVVDDGVVWGYGLVGGP
jgi:hypothetical protein